MAKPPMIRAIGKLRDSRATVWEVLQDGLQCSICERHLQVGEAVIKRGRNGQMVCERCDPRQRKPIRPYRGKRRLLFEYELDALMSLTPGHRRLAPALLTLLRDREGRGINYLTVDEAAKKLVLSDVATRRLAAAMAAVNLLEIFETWQSPWQQVVEIRLITQTPPSHHQAGPRCTVLDDVPTDVVTG